MTPVRNRPNSPRRPPVSKDSTKSRGADYPGVGRRSSAAVRMGQDPSRHEFLVNGAQQFGEPGVFMSFEENAETSPRT